MHEIDQGPGVRAPWSAAIAAVWLWCGAMLGLGLQLQQAALWPMPLYAALCGAGLLLWLGVRWQGWGPARWWAGPVCLLAGALAMAGLTGLRAEVRAQDRLSAALEGGDLDIVAVVADMPQWQQDGWRMVVRVEAARTASGQTVQTDQLPRRIALGWYDSSARYEALAWAQPQAALPEVQAGERWRWRVRLKAPHGQRNPGGFDLELWMCERGLGASGYVRASRHDPPPQRLGQSGQHPVQWLRQQVRDALLAGPGGEAQTRAVLAALVTGDQAVIGAQRWEVFRITGVAHLMSISGVHITMLAWLMAALVRGLWRHLARHGSAWPLRLPAPAAGALAGLLLAAAYAFFSGWGVPAQRTVSMLAVVSVLQLVGLRWPWWWIWGAALLAVVLGDPWAVLQVGFWLSFVAVGALLMVGRGANTELQALRTTAVPARLALVQGTGLGQPWLRLRTALWGLVREQAVVTAALTPLCMLFFGQVSLAGLLANLLAIPWITLCITPLSLLGMLVPPLWDLATLLLQPLLVLLETMADWPGAQLLTPRAPLWLALPAVLGGLWAVWPGAGHLRLMGLALVWPALVWQAPRPAHGSFELWLADVGQGSAVLVRTARHTLLYDTGPRYSPESDAGHRVLQPLLQSLGDRPDAVVLSHSDSDHTGGAATVRALARDALWWSSLPADHPLWTSVVPAVPAARPCGAGEGWTWDGVLFAFEHPPLPWPQGQPSNAMSCVLRVTAARPEAVGPAAGGPAQSAAPASALLTGDIGLRQEQALLARGLAPVDLLLVPHHGSASSSGEAFLRALQPRWSVVQAGYRNRFGHPALLVRERYRALGLPLVETARCGAARWHSGQPETLLCERTLRARYWHWQAPQAGP